MLHWEECKSWTWFGRGTIWLLSVRLAGRSVGFSVWCFMRFWGCFSGWLSRVYPLEWSFLAWAAACLPSCDWESTITGIIFLGGVGRTCWGPSCVFLWVWSFLQWVNFSIFLFFWVIVDASIVQFCPSWGFGWIGRDCFSTEAVLTIFVWVRTGSSQFGLRVRQVVDGMLRARFVAAWQLTRRWRVFFWEICFIGSATKHHLET